MDTRGMNLAATRSLPTRGGWIEISLAVYLS